MGNVISIEVASNILGVCKQTLRRWDETGKLKAARSESGYRLYYLNDLQKHIPEDKAKGDKA